MLTDHERSLLLAYCADHLVARCARCLKSHGAASLAVDLRLRKYRCGSCGGDLTESVIGHAKNCPNLCRREDAGTRFSDWQQPGIQKAYSVTIEKRAQSPP